MEASGESVFERTVAGSELGAQPKEAQGGQKAWGEENNVQLEWERFKIRSGTLNI